MGKRHSRTKEITIVEGGSWIPWKRGVVSLKYVNAIKFADGSIWDTVNGWRSGEDIPKQPDLKEINPVVKDHI